MTAPRILVVGASGRVGRLLAGAWRAEPPTRAAITLQSRRTEGGTLIWSPEDSCDPLHADIDRNGPIAAMIVLAGVTPATGDDMQVNVRIAETCLRCAAEAAIPRILLASSSAIYGAGTGKPFTEADPPAPMNDYGRSKLAMERAAEAFTELEVCSLRIGNVAGADALVLNASKATPETPVRIDRFSDGTGPLRNYIGPGTLARVLECLALHPDRLPPVLNLATPDPIAMDALARAAGFPWTFVPAPETAVHRVTLDCTLLAALYPFTEADSDPTEMIRQLKATT